MRSKRKLMMRPSVKDPVSPMKIFLTFTAVAKHVIEPVKLLLFLILISFYFLLNSLFINEKYISKKFHIKTYSFKILIVRIILVTTFGLLLNLFINCHFSIKKQIKNLLKYEKSQNIKLKMLEFVKSNDKKFLIFFSIMLLLNIFFFIYITSLCFVFKNTQSEWFCVSIITILLIQIFPFFLLSYLYINEIFRIKT